MTVKKCVHKYSGQIESLTNFIKKEISNSGRDYSEKELHELVESSLFSSDHINEISYQYVKDCIDCIFRRVKSKYGILHELLEENSINEIMVNGTDKIFVEKNRQIVEIDDAFTSATELEDMIRMFAADVHREINEANPIVDARLSQGFRVNGVLQNVALNGPILTIRKFSDKSITIDDLIEFGSISRECSDFLCKLVKCGYNIFISGGTSSGKTTFLNALTEAISISERAVIIEDSAELKVGHLNNIVHMECRSANSIGKGEVTMEKLIKTSLRMRPDRIIVGEVRGREVVDMIQAMNTGHSGSMSTGHGNSIEGMLNRLETMYLMDSEIPMYSVKNQIANAIEIMVHLERGSDGRRGVVEVAELYGFDGEKYKLNYLYETNRKGDFVKTNNSLINEDRLVKGDRNA